MIKKGYVAKIDLGEELDAPAKIIKAGLEEFAMCSIGAARTREIAARAGVNHAAINYYFGGKEELYMEIARQITDYIDDYMAPYFEQSKIVLESGSRADAKQLLVDFVTSRVCPEDRNNIVLRCIILIITREELYHSTAAFKMFFERLFRPTITLLSKLVEQASAGAYKGQTAKIVAEMFLGQIHMFNSARVGLKSLNEWTVFGESEIAEVKRIFSELADKILK